VGSGSSRNTSHMIHAASGTRSGAFMGAPHRLMPAASQAYNSSAP
jgi:hypothetical protein